MSSANPTYYDGINEIGERCRECIGDQRDLCNMLLNATVAVQEISTVRQAGNHPAIEADPNHVWVKEMLTDRGCELSSLGIDELIATACSDPDTREYLRGTGEIIVGVNCRTNKEAEGI